MDVERDAAGDLWFRSISPLHADTLLRIGEWTDCSDVAVRERLLPEVYEDDDEAQEHWDRYGNPELVHLFANRLDIINGDLQKLERDSELTFSLCIPAGHEAAWLSSLNAARVALFEISELEAVDMERDPAELEDPEKELALVRIHIMAYMQEMMMEA